MIRAEQFIFPALLATNEFSWLIIKIESKKATKLAALSFFFTLIFTANGSNFDTRKCNGHIRERRFLHSQELIGQNQVQDPFTSLGRQKMLPFKFCRGQNKKNKSYRVKLIILSENFKIFVRATGPGALHALKWLCHWLQPLLFEILPSSPKVFSFCLDFFFHFKIF